MSPLQTSIWKQTIASAPEGHLRAIDYGLVLAFVAQQAILVQACQSQIEFERRGLEQRLLVAGRKKSSKPLPSPYLGMINRAVGHVTRLAVELGLSPISRSRLTAALPFERDADATAFDAILASRPTLLKPN